MFDDTTPTWWYEDAGQQAGPVTAAGLHRLIAGGRVSPAHRVWRNGMRGWEPIAQVAELAPMLQAAPAPAAPPPLEPPQAAGGTFEEIPVGVTILLAIVTFGIYGLVKFYQTGRAYEQLAGRESKFPLYFWLFIGLGLGGILVNAASGFFGIPLGIASVVFQVLSLVEALQVREEGMRRNGIVAQVTSPATHKTLLILAIVLSFILVGLVLSIIQAWKWFSDWNAIVAAMRGRSRMAP